MLAVLSVCLASLALELKRNQIAKSHKKLYSLGCYLLEIKILGRWLLLEKGFPNLLSQIQCQLQVYQLLFLQQQLEEMSLSRFCFLYLVFPSELWVVSRGASWKRQNLCRERALAGMKHFLVNTDRAWPSTFYCPYATIFP